MPNFYIHPDGTVFCDGVPPFVVSYLNFLSLNIGRRKVSLPSLASCLRELCRLALYVDRFGCSSLEDDGLDVLESLDGSACTLQAVSELTLECFRLYFAALALKGKNKPTTIARKTVTFRAFYDYLYANAAELEIYLPDNPLEGVPTDCAAYTYNFRRLPEGALKKAIRLCDEDPGNGQIPTGVRDALILSLLGSAGLTLSEAAGLNVDDIHANSLYIRTGTVKRYVTIPDSTERLARRYLIDFRSQPDISPHETALLVSTTSFTRLSVKSIEKIVTKRMSAAGFLDWRPKDLRRACICQVLYNTPKERWPRVFTDFGLDPKQRIYLVYEDAVQRLYGKEKS